MCLPFASFTSCLSFAIDWRTFFRFSSTSELGLNLGWTAAEVSDEDGKVGGGVVCRLIILCLSAARVALDVLDGGSCECEEAASWNLSRSGMLSLCRESGRPTLSWLSWLRPDGWREGGLAAAGNGKPPPASRSLLESRLLSRLAKPEAPPPNLERPISWVAEEDCLMG